ncbi:hypothetical protein O181_037402 [Austropuccinia psidii MF-1]|uniref:Rab-GAP TBC domain-containing protein n=1 Tax=Austropuccinia psidii MF-1 TaxID=1389203 RepID=A0A9Q3DCM1_9BASI|nr:hypothetical protein [Austropuccinia psidii MF-1]
MSSSTIITSTIYQDPNHQNQDLNLNQNQDLNQNQNHYPNHHLGIPRIKLNQESPSHPSQVINPTHFGSLEPSNSTTSFSSSSNSQVSVINNTRLSSQSQIIQPTIDDQSASAQHVRQVYAHLDKVGVPGDGFLDGTERTRQFKRLSAHLSNHSRGQSLSDQELQVLQCADRYGFFRPPSSERVFQVQSPAFFPAIGPSPQLIQSNSINSNDSQVNSKETSRIDKWSEMLMMDPSNSSADVASYCLRTDWENMRDRFEKRCFKGIPDRWRTVAWEMLMKEFEKRHSNFSSSISSSKLNHLIHQFNFNLNKPSDYDIQIDLDVPRTINGHIFFHTRYGKGQRALFQVLHAFGLYCKTCGYCQGMGPIAATLLNYLDKQSAFISMVRIHDLYGYHQVFAPGFPGLLECFYIQEKIIEYLLPTVHETFQKQMISTSAYATKWYITIFSNTVSYEAQLRLWDVFFLKGIDSLILASVSIVYALRSAIGPGNDFEQILSTLGGKFEFTNPDSWLRSIRKLFKRQDIQGLISRCRREWKGFVDDGTANSRVT